MTSLSKYIQEKLVINKNYRDTTSDTTIVKSFDELRKIIKDRYDKLGPGTEQNPIDFNDIDVSEITTFCNDMKNRGLFQETQFEYIDISVWDVSNVENMNWMFYECENLKSIGDISNWDVSNVTNMKRMFSHCFKLETIGDLSKWDVSKVTNMTHMFIGCVNLESIGDISNWNISNVKDISYMFHNSGITNIPDWYKG